jgi:rubrerythrin
MDLIDQIEETRAQNNRCWMDLLRLAIEAEPEKAKQILEQIEQHDNQIRRLLKALASD